MFKKTLILSSLASVLILASCSNDSDRNTDPYAGQSTNDNNQLVVNIGSDMPSIDPQQSSDNSSSRVIEDILKVWLIIIRSQRLFQRGHLVGRYPKMVRLIHFI